ncbi:MULTISPECIES: M24 family metallopeptidase [unclassified Streptomyces]|uniref:M24 family metallopeptidase n=1 Tax=unclassified Streptomyces TaxID=2593676 RepID=UPI002238903B|nr:Xaa-Pro peptidase family protein [Streptomyces sp. SHP 1-2]MCW5254128.1 aminopeptidase P family protein [Streptomyces sp. SHP 1-2]
MNTTTTKDLSERMPGELAAAGLDGVLLLGLENVQFAAGAPLRSASMLDRPNLVWWPREGRPVVYTSEETVPTVASMTTITDIVGYDEQGARFPSGIVDTVAADLLRRGLGSAAIGYESDRMPVVFFQRLSALLPGARLLPGDAVLRTLRMVKDEGSIEIMTRAARLTELALAACIEGVRVGESEREAADRLTEAMRGHGFGNVDPLVGTGEGAARIGPPTDRLIREGDYLRLDVKSRYQGLLYTDAGRMAVIGTPTEAQKAAYAAQYTLNRRVMDFIRPGRTCGEVYLYCREQTERLGIRLFNYGHIGIGHGIGVSGTERPSLHARDETVLVPGMVINIEPDTYGPAGEILHIEDMLLVTEDGVEPLSHRDDWSALPVVPA